VPLAQSALGGEITTIGQQGLLKNNDTSVPQEIIDLNLYRILRVEEPVNYDIELHLLVDRIKYRIWAEDHKWEYGAKRRVIRTWKREGKAARDSLDRDYRKLLMLKWRVRKPKKPGTSETSDEAFECVGGWSDKIAHTVHTRGQLFV
jgi:hypothetical protein